MEAEVAKPPAVRLEAVKGE
jgi:hypothetical protein